MWVVLFQKFSILLNHLPATVLSFKQKVLQSFLEPDYDLT